MNSRQQNKVDALERRRVNLRRRIAEYEGDPDRAKAELAAVNYALQIIKAAEMTGILDDLEHMGVAV